MPKISDSVIQAIREERPNGSVIADVGTDFRSHQKIVDGGVLRMVIDDAGVVSLASSTVIL